MTQHVQTRPRGGEASTTPSAELAERLVAHLEEILGREVLEQLRRERKCWIGAGRTHARGCVVADPCSDLAWVRSELADVLGGMPPSACCASELWSGINPHAFIEMSELLLLARVDEGPAIIEVDTLVQDPARLAQQAASSHGLATEWERAARAARARVRADLVGPESIILDALSHARPRVCEALQAPWSPSEPRVVVIDREPLRRTRNLSYHLPRAVGDDLVITSGHALFRTSQSVFRESWFATLNALVAVEGWEPTGANWRLEAKLGLELFASRAEQLPAWRAGSATAWQELATECFVSAVSAVS